MHPISKFLFPALAILVLVTGMGSPLALMLGIAAALIFGNPYQGKTKKLVTPLLQIAVVGLGAGMNLNTVLRAGAQGFVYTVIGIGLTLFMGEKILRAVFKTSPATSFLITVGTAICGGSAIAAVSGAIRAKDGDISVALATVFLLNSVALLVFPPLGHWAGLTDSQFGLWCALAIHDTSSVVGASMQFGPHALEIATTVKLARALWIAPLTFAVTLGWLGRSARNDAAEAGKTKKPWFILGFLAAAALFTWVPGIEPAGALLYSISKRLLVLTLFLIGGNLTLATIKGVGAKPFLQGVSLWIIAASSSLAAILLRWVK